MTRGVRIRIIAFCILSAVGIVYITGTYLGVVDRLLGRGLTVHATLPESGGLFVGSEVTYRGVKVGKVSAMEPTRAGVRMDLALEEGTRIPADAPMYVHNLSAVGEQYLDFEPTDDQGPYAQEGDTLRGSAASMPVTEPDLLLELDGFVNSVDHDNLRTTVRELGDMFYDTGRPLQRLLDGGGRFVDTAAANEEATVRLLRRSRTVLRTQRQQGDNITNLSRDLRLVTDSLRRSDRDLERTLVRTPPAVREVGALMKDLEPTLPVLLGNLVTVNQVVVNHIEGVEQLLVTFPAAISTGFSGTPGDGYGHVNLQLDNSVPPCTEGYMSPSQWRRGDQTNDTAIFPARCASGAPYNMRGSKYAPEPSGTAGSAYRSTYDPASGLVAGVGDRKGGPIRLGQQPDLSVMGGESWKWLMVGPVATR